MRILRAADHRLMPWKNGKGETIEVAAHPPGSDIDGFHWRVSMAVVDADGPFSLFPDVDRTLSVLTGEGIELDVAGLGTRRLTPQAEPFTFPADAPTTARLLAGPIRDLNVMTRRGAATHCVRHLLVAGSQGFDYASDWALLLAQGRIAVRSGDGAPVGLDAGDAVLLTRGAPEIHLSAPLPTSVFAVTIDAVVAKQP